MIVFTQGDKSAILKKQKDQITQSMINVHTVIHRVFFFLYFVKTLSQYVTV